MEEGSHPITKKDIGLYNCFFSFVIRGTPKLTQQLCINTLNAYEMVGFKSYKKKNVSIRTFVFSKDPIIYTLFDSVDINDCYFEYNADKFIEIVREIYKLPSTKYVCNIVLDNIIENFKAHPEIINLELRRRNTGVNIYYLVEDKVKLPKELKYNCDRCIEAPEGMAFIERKDIQFKQFYIKDINF